MYHKDSPSTIQGMFNEIAHRYDLANAILSLSLHQRWNCALVRHIQQKEAPQVLLDLCAGTGDIAFAYLRKASSCCRAYLIDFSSEMLERAKLKESHHRFPYSHDISYLQADVQALPLPNQSIDCATLAYGIRNVQHPALCVAEVFRVLRPGGRLGILELTRPRHPLLRWGHHMYLRTFMPLLGKWLTDNKQAYQYLCQSIQTFIAPEELKYLITASGFLQTEVHSLAGGIATIITAHKPT